MFERVDKTFIGNGTLFNKPARPLLITALPPGKKKVDRIRRGCLFVSDFSCCLDAFAYQLNRTKSRGFADDLDRRPCLAQGAREPAKGFSGFSCFGNRHSRCVTGAKGGLIELLGKLTEQVCN